MHRKKIVRVEQEILRKEFNFLLEEQNAMADIRLLRWNIYIVPCRLTETRVLMGWGFEEEHPGRISSV